MTKEGKLALFCHFQILATRFRVLSHLLLTLLKLLDAKKCFIKNSKKYHQVKKNASSIFCLF